MDITVNADVLNEKCSKTEEISASYKEQQPTINYLEDKKTDSKRQQQQIFLYIVIRWTN